MFETLVFIAFGVLAVFQAFLWAWVAEISTQWGRLRAEKKEAWKIHEWQEKLKRELGALKGHLDVEVVRRWDEFGDPQATYEVVPIERCKKCKQRVGVE